MNEKMDLMVAEIFYRASKGNIDGLREVIVESLLEMKKIGAEEEKKENRRIARKVRAKILEKLRYHTVWIPIRLKRHHPNAEASVGVELMSDIVMKLFAKEYEI